MESRILSNIRQEGPFRMSLQDILNKYKINTPTLMQIGMKSRPNLARLYGVNENKLNSILNQTLNRSDTVRLILYSGTMELPKELKTRGAALIKQLFEYYSNPINFKPEFREVSVRSKFKTYASYTREYKLKRADKIPYDMLTIKLIYEGKAHALNIFRTGKLTFTGGYPDYEDNIYETPSKVLGIVFRKGKKYAKSSYQINSVTAQYDTHLRGDLSNFKRVLSPESNKKNRSKFITFRDELDGELVTVRVYGSGTVQISQIKTQKQFEMIPDFIESEVIEPLLAEEVAKKAFRFQKIVKTKPQKRSNQNVAPDVVFRSTTCPKNRRPIPYKFTGQPPRAGMYVGVNPQGQPCCYSVPKKLAYIQPKVIERFKSLGIQIPPLTKKLLRLDVNNSNRPTNVSSKNNKTIIFRTAEYVRKGQKLKALKIGSRLCERYSMMRLVDLARRLGVAMDVKGKSKKMTKKQLCQSISKWAQSKGRLNSVKKSVTSTGAMRGFNNKGETRLGNRGRIATSYSKSKLLDKAEKLGVTGVSESMTINSIIDEIRRQLKLN